MRKRITGKKVEKSSFYKTAKSAASEYAHSPKKLNELLDKAAKKAQSSKGRLQEVWDSLLTCFRLLRAYATGRYRDIPWASLLSIVAAVIYFVMPLDLIPDFILSLGLIDDAVLLAWILSSLKNDIDHFIEWEQAQTEEVNNGDDKPEHSSESDDEV